MAIELDEGPSISGIELDDEPTFGSGTRARMKEYEGLGPTQAAAKYRQSWEQSLKNAYSVATDPQKLGQVLKGMGREAYTVANQPLGKTVHDIARYYYQNPDIAATDVATMAMPMGYVGKAGEAAEAIPAASRLQRLGKEGTRPLDIPVEETPTKAVAGAKIQEAKEAGEEFPAEDANKLIGDIRETLKDPEYGYDFGTHPAVATALGHIDRILGKNTLSLEADPVMSRLGPRARAQVRLQTMEGGTGHTFVDLHNARKNLKRAFAAGGEQARMAGKIEEKLDDYAFSLPKGEQFKQGLDEYARAAKLDEIDEIKRKADLASGSRYTTAGWAHAVATELKKIASNPKKLRLWTPDEQARIEKIAGRKDLSDRIFRTMGRMSVRGPASLGADAVIGHLLHGIIPGGPYGLMLAGEVGRQLERAGIERQVRGFEELVAKGGKEEKLRPVIGDQAVETIKSTADGKRALAAWTKKATKTSTRALAIAIARSANMPQLVPRIENEINDIEPVSN